MFVKYLNNYLIKKLGTCDIMTVPKELMKILACPKCKGDVKEKKMFIVCKKCELAYPVLDEDVPNMLIEESWKLNKAEKVNFKHSLKL